MSSRDQVLKNKHSMLEAGVDGQKKINKNKLLCGSDGKTSARKAGDPGSIPGPGRSLEKAMATHSSTLA